MAKKGPDLTLAQGRLPRLAVGHVDARLGFERDLAAVDLPAATRGAGDVHLWAGFTTSRRRTLGRGLRVRDVVVLMFAPSVGRGCLLPPLPALLRAHQEPVFIEYQEAYERAAIVLGYPKLGVSYDPLRNPAPYFVIGVGGHRDRGLRSLAGAEVESRHRNCIPVGSPPKPKPESVDGTGDVIGV